MQQGSKKALVLIGWVLVATGAWTSANSQEPEKKPQDAKEQELAERAMVSPGLDSANLALAYPDQVVWLESERSGRALALFEPEQTAQSAGAILLLADEGQSADAGLAGAIRQHFVEAGWAAMTVGLPAMPLALEQARRVERRQPPVADAEADTVPASIMIDVMNSDELDKMETDYRDRVQVHLAAAVGNLTERGYSRLVLVGVGRGAGHVILQGASGPAGQAPLVLITPEFDVAEEDAIVASLKAVAGLPVLDIVSSRSDRAPSKERRSLMKREGIGGYQQQAVAIGPRPLPREAKGLANRITAWLQSRI